jgi:hypothetical protein
MRGRAASHHANDAIDKFVALGFLGFEGKEFLDGPGLRPGFGHHRSPSVGRGS